MADKLRASEIIQDGYVYISKAEANRQMVDMLTEIKAEIVNVYACNNEAKFIRMTCRDIIQEKIKSYEVNNE